MAERGILMEAYGKGKERVDAKKEELAKQKAENGK